MTLSDLRAEGALVDLRGAAGVYDAVRITGHASGRRFYRVSLRNGPHTAVLVVYPSEQQEEIDRHVRTTEWLQAADVRVPRVLARGARALMVEDGGDGLLSEARSDASATQGYYAQAASIIAAIQRYGASVPMPNPGWALDAARLRAELEFAECHAIGGWFDATNRAEERGQLFDRLAELVAALPQAACHRDFHGRNLLLVAGQVWVIDFQDLMIGPSFYDAASLLWDNYCDLTPQVTAATLGTLWPQNASAVQVTRAAAVPMIPEGLPAAARQAFCLTGLQRSLKALGTFGYQVHELGNEDFADYVPRTWEHVQRSASALGWQELLGVLPDFALAGRPRF